MSNTNRAMWYEEVVNGVRTQVDWGFVEEERRVENIHPWMRLAEALNGYPQDAAFPARKIADYLAQNAKCNLVRVARSFSLNSGEEEVVITLEGDGDNGKLRRAQVKIFIDVISLLDREIADPQRRIEALCSMVLQAYKNYSVEKDIDKE